MSRILATLSVVALLVHSQAGFEFTQIMGFVTFDDAKATPIQGAEVRIIGLGSAITTKSGEFSIKANVLMIGQKITLQVAMPGWRISTSQPIEIIVPKDSVANPLRIKMRKDLTTTPARAPSSGIFVSRIVGEIGDERRATTASIWLTAAGEYNYVIDSIVIRHQPGPLFSGGSGAVKPDATYSFMFRVHADQTEPLIPALRLDRNDRREVWFTLGLAPDDSFSTSGGSVDVRLQYHIENSGAAGVLRLTSVPEDVAVLAHMVKKDICVGGLRIDHTGLVKGDDETAGSCLDYSPIVLNRDFVEFYTSEASSDRTLPITIPAGRGQLNSAILRNTNEIVQRLQSGNSMMFDLCAGLHDHRCEDALLSASADNKLWSKSLHALVVRYALNESNALPAVVLEVTMSRFRSDATWTLEAMSNELAAVLANRHSEHWLDALASLARIRTSSRNVLRAVTRSSSSLTDDERRQISDLCNELLNEVSPPIEAAEFLVRSGIPLADISERLRILPAGIAESDRDSAVRNRSAVDAALKRRFGRERHR